MKHLVIFLCLSGILNAQMAVREPIKQIEVGKVTQMGNFLYEIIGYPNETDTAYTLYFRNQKYQHIVDVQSFRFSSQGNTLNEFHKLLKGMVAPDGKKKMDVTIGKTALSIEYKKSMGTPYLFIWCDQGYFNITEKHIDKLFGK